MDYRDSDRMDNLYGNLQAYLSEYSPYNYTEDIKEALELNPQLLGDENSAHWVLYYSFKKVLPREIIDVIHSFLFVNAKEFFEIQELK